MYFWLILDIRSKLFGIIQSATIIVCTFICKFLDGTNLVFSCRCSPPLPVLLPASTGQGLQISAQLVRRDGQVFYSLLFENNSQVALDGFMIQFNKNTFGLAAAGPLQVDIIFEQPLSAFSIFLSLT